RRSTSPRPREEPQSRRQGSVSFPLMVALFTGPESSFAENQMSFPSTQARMRSRYDDEGQLSRRDCGADLHHLHGRAPVNEPLRYDPHRAALEPVAGDADRNRTGRTLHMGDFERQLKLKIHARGRCGGPPVPGMTAGLLLVVAGLLLFLDNLGILPFANPGAYWP